LPTQPDPIRIASIPWTQGEAELSHLRRVVFVEEQGVPEALEWDGLDRRCVHLMAQDSTGQVIGCARLTPDGQIGRMAVLPERRGQGIGGALLRAAIAAARERGWEPVYVHAQIHAQRFYARHGFVADGEPFCEAGIDHLRMALPDP
jgi:predicted GNAT family N-acyltransferase